MLYPAVNLKDLEDIPADVRERLELVPVETMEDVFRVALDHVIVPQCVDGGYVIEVDEDDVPPEAEVPSAEGQSAPEAPAAGPPRADQRPRLLGPDGHEL